MTFSLLFSVRFHQPFLVRSGRAGLGLDARARVDAVLPASSLKGAMRHSALHVLGIDASLVNEIFGKEGRIGDDIAGASWAWTDAGPAAAFESWTRARNRVDPTAGVARPEALTLTEEIWQRPETEAEFAVEQIRSLEGAARQRHVAVLQGAAFGVTALGSWRNRSMGAVTLRPRDPDPNLRAVLKRLLQRGAS